MNITTVGIKAVTICGAAIESLSAGASFTPATDRIVAAIQGDNVAGNIGVEYVLDDLSTWVEADDINGTAIVAGTDQPIMLPTLAPSITGKSRFTSAAGATKKLQYYYWKLT